MGAQCVGDNRKEGIAVGYDSTVPVGFQGATPSLPVVLPAAVATTAPTSTNPFGFTQAQAAAIIEVVNAVRAALISKGLCR